MPQKRFYFKVSSSCSEFRVHQAGVILIQVLPTFCFSYWHNFISEFLHVKYSEISYCLWIMLIIWFAKLEVLRVLRETTCVFEKRITSKYCILKYTYSTFFYALSYGMKIPAGHHRRCKQQSAQVNRMRVLNYFLLYVSGNNKKPLETL